MKNDNIDKRTKEVGDVIAYHDIRNASKSGMFQAHGFREIIVPNGQKEDPDRYLEEQANRTKRVVRKVAIVLRVVAAAALLIWCGVANFKSFFQGSMNPIPNYKFF